VLRDVILTPNEHELELIGDRTQHSGQSAATLVRDHALRAVIVTLGSDGVRLTTDEQELHVPAYAVPVVVDSTGAGDAFNAALAWSLTRGMSLEDGVRWAAAAGAFSTQAVGAQGSLPTIRLLELLAGLHVKPSEPPFAPPS
jgi:ribokinase